MPFHSYHSTYIDSKSTQVLDFRKAVEFVEDNISQHPLNNLMRSTPFLDLATGGAAPKELVTIKANTLTAIVLTDEYVPEDGDLVPPDKLGYFTTFPKFVSFESKLHALSLDCDEIATIMAVAKGLQRNAHEFSPLIVLLRNAIQVFCDTNGLSFELVVRLVLWHELGHAIFNPNLNVDVLNQELLKPQTVDGISYKRSKAFQFLVEGAAEWFALNAEPWDDQVKSCLFALDPANTKDEYTYVTVLSSLPHLALVRVLLPFALGLPGIALQQLPVDKEAGRFKLTHGDFASPDQGMNYSDLGGLADYLALGTTAVFGLAELVILDSILPEMHDERTLDHDLYSGLQVGTAPYTRPSFLSLRVQLPLFGNNPKQVPRWAFDPFILPPPLITDKSESKGQELSVGVRFQGVATSVLALDRKVIQGQVARHIAYTLDSRGEGKVVVWGSEKEWSETVARRAAIALLFS